jgi:hypothetical protein
LLDMADIVNPRLRATQSGDNWDISLDWSVAFVPLEVSNNFLYDTSWTLWEHDSLSDDDKLEDRAPLKIRPQGRQKVDLTETITFNETHSAWEDFTDGDLYAVAHLKNLDLNSPIQDLRSPRLNIDV